jgi:hypothetical protein
MSANEPYKATVTIEITAPSREAAPVVFAQALEVLGMGATQGEGHGSEPDTYYRVTVEENQKGAPLSAEEFLSMGLPPKG